MGSSMSLNVSVKVRLAGDAGYEIVSEAQATLPADEVVSRSPSGALSAVGTAIPLDARILAVGSRVPIVR